MNLEVEEKDDLKVGKGMANRSNTPPGTLRP
jgi:hypothetical protein